VNKVSVLACIIVSTFFTTAAFAQQQQTSGGNICFSWYSLDPTNNRVVTGEITNADPIHSWVFEGQASTFINIRLEVLGNTLDPFLYLIDQTTEQRVRTSSSNEQTSDGRRVISIRGLALGSDGLYTINVTRLGEMSGTTAGNYRLSLEPSMETVVAGNVQDAPIYDSEVVRGQLLTATSDGWYFDGSSGEQITIVVRDTSELASSAPAQFTVGLQAYVDDAWDVQSSASSAQGEARLVNYTLPLTARYAIIIGITSEDNLTYQLTLAGAGRVRNNDLPCIQPPAQCPESSPIGVAGIPLRNEEPAPGNITNANFISAYQFTAFADDRITVEMLRSGGDLNTFLGLADVAGNILARDEGFDPPVARINNFRVPEDGCYFIYASRDGVADGNTEGTFTLTASGIPVDPSQVLPQVPEGVTFLRDVSLGEAANGTITNDDWRVAFRFRADSNGTFTATATRSGDSSTLIPSVELYDAQFNLLDRVTANFVGNLSNPLTYAGEAGKYYFIVVQREGGASGTSSGDFTLNVISNP